MCSSGADGDVHVPAVERCVGPHVVPEGPVGVRRLDDDRVRRRRTRHDLGAGVGAGNGVDQGRHRPGQHVVTEGRDQQGVQAKRRDVGAGICDAPAESEIQPADVEQAAWRHVCGIEQVRHQVDAQMTGDLHVPACAGVVVGAHPRPPSPGTNVPPGRH